jgi:hypothetical protein
VCVREDRIVQVHRRSKTIRDAEGVRAKFGVSPALIPDYLALVGDSVDGYPGMAGVGQKARTPPRTLWPDRGFPAAGSGRAPRPYAAIQEAGDPSDDAPLFRDIGELKWLGPMEHFSRVASLEQVRRAPRTAPPTVSPLRKSRRNSSAKVVARGSKPVISVPTTPAAYAFSIRTLTSDGTHGMLDFPQEDIARYSAMGGEEIHEAGLHPAGGGESLRYKGPIQERFDALAPARR